MLVHTDEGTTVELLGAMVDDETRCRHYHTELDIIAIKFRCCGKYYPCYQCHEEIADHEPERYRIGDGEKVVLCGGCLREMTFEQYKGLECGSCGGRFNPGCKLHYGVYFEGVSEAGEGAESGERMKAR